MEVKNKKTFLSVLLIVLIFCSNFSYYKLNANDEMYVNVWYLNLRTNWNHNSKILKVLNKWESISLIWQSENGWQKVVTNDWITWFLKEKFLSNIEPYYEKTQWDVYEVNVNSAFVRWENFKTIRAVVWLWNKLEVIDNRIINWLWIKVRILESSYNNSYVWREWYISKKIVSVSETNSYYDEEYTEDDIQSNSMNNQNEEENSNDQANIMNTKNIVENKDDQANIMNSKNSNVESDEELDDLLNWLFK